MVAETNTIKRASAGRPYYSESHNLMRRVHSVDLPQAGGTAIADAIVVARISGCTRVTGVGVNAKLGNASNLTPFLREVGSTRTDSQSSGISQALSDALVLTTALGSDYSITRSVDQDKDTEYELVLQLSATIAAAAANGSTIEIFVDTVVT